MSVLLARLNYACLALLLSALLIHDNASAISKINASKLKSAGVRTVACPKHFGLLRSGLFDASLPKHWVCANGASLKSNKKLSKYITPKTLLLDGRVNSGFAFDSVFNQEGDVQTGIFEVANMPAKIYWEVTNSDYKAQVQIAVYDAETGRKKYEKIAIRGEGSSHFAFNFPGRYFVRVNGYGHAPKGEDGEEIQPMFSVSMEFMYPYENGTLTSADLKDSEIKTSKCPSQLLDLDSGNLYKLKGATCTKRDSLEDAYFLQAPFNLARQVFMATEIFEAEEGSYTSYPFRIIKPSLLRYSVQDPTGGKGKTSIYMMDMATGKAVYTIVKGVKGSIQGSTTSLNIPGDYFFMVETDPSDPEENGDISWSLEITPEK